MGTPSTSMKKTALLSSLFCIFLPLAAQETVESDAEVYEYHVGEVDYLSGEGVDLGGFVFPSLYFNAVGGVTGSGAGAGDFSSSPHDPKNEAGIQAIHLHLDLEFSEAVTGMLNGFGFQGEDHVWEAELEEAFLRWELADHLSIRGGQFINAFGFQSDLHLHDWFFVNQNLTNSRMLNEGEWISQGGEVRLGTRRTGLLSLALGGVRSHSHDHAHRHGGGEHGEHEEEPHQDEHDHDHDGDHHGAHWRDPLEAAEADFQSWVVSGDYRFRLPFDDRVTGSVSLALGENGFDRNTRVYGFGLRKVWNGHDHGFGGPDFCSGALMLQSEFIGREVEARAADGTGREFDDYGFSHSMHYGVSDQVTASLRHDWVSAVEMARLDDRHRLSAALTAFVDPEQRVRARVQYDYLRDKTIGGEHVAWFQIQLQWGGIGGSHAGHGH